MSYGKLGSMLCHMVDLVESYVIWLDLVARYVIWLDLGARYVIW